MKILVTGGTGFIGQPLLQALKDHELIALSRSPSSARAKLGSTITIIQGDLENAQPDLTRLGDLDAVIHLAGESIASGRWTPSTKNHILHSRIAGTENLIAALAKLKNPPRIFIAASAIGFYGSRGDQVLTEDSSVGEGFLASVCQKWEQASENLSPATRRVIFRFGLVLGKGGALEKMLPPFKLGLGGRIGNGHQWMSWIHQKDLIRLIESALLDARYEGIVNAVAPQSITNQTFTYTLGSVLRKPTLIPIPEFALKLAFGQMAEETLLASQRVDPLKARKLNFEYTYPTLMAGLSDILGK